MSDDKGKSHVDTYWILKRGTLVLLRPWATFYVQGAENVPKEGAVLCVSNHTSYLDPVAIGNVSPRRVIFMGKAELFKNKIINWLLRGVDGFPVKRGEADMTAFKTALGFLKAGRLVCIFPEGTRQDSEEVLGPPEPGAATFAIKTGCTVVPVFVSGPGSVLDRKGKLHRGKITVAYGTPFTLPKTTDRDEGAKTLMAAIAQTRDFWRGQPAVRVPVFSPMPPREDK